MLTLIKFELKKIMGKSLFLIIGVLVILLCSLYENGYKKDTTSLSLIKKYETHHYTRAQVDKLYNKELKTQSYSAEGDFIWYKLWPYFPNTVKPVYTIFGKQLNHAGIKNYMKKLSNKNLKNTYKYKVFEKAEKMTRNLGELKYKYLWGWRDLNEVTEFINPILILVMLVVGLSSLFSEEYSINTAHILLSTKKGKTKLTTAKIIAGLIYTSVIFLVITAMSFLQVIINWHDQAKLPFNLFANSSPYNLTVGSEYGLSLIITFIGIIAFSLFVIFLSLTFKNGIYAFITSVAVYVLPLILSLITSVSWGIIGFLKSISLKSMFEGIDLFNSFECFNVFGNVVMRPTLLVIFAVVFIVLVYALIKYLGKKQVVA